MRPLLALALSLPASATAATLTVGPSGDHPSLQSAVDAASPGDLIRVEAVDLVGATTIDKSLTVEGASRATTSLTATTDVIVVQAGLDVVLRDLTLTGGGARGLSGSDANLTLERVGISGGASPAGGAGVYVVGGELTLSDSVFDDNRAAEAFGGHVLAEGAEVTVTGTDFVRGRAERGGAIMVTDGALRVVGGTFADNAVRSGDNRGVGGAIATEFAEVHIEGAEFVDNTATDGQGGHLSIYRGPGFTIADSSLVGTEGTPSATVYFGGGIVVFDADAVVRGVSFADLSVEHTGEEGTYGYGGALFIYGQLDRPFLVEDCSFEGNTATGFGGAVRVESGAGTVLRSTFDDNEGDYGGGLHVASDLPVRVEASTFTGNRARYGAALRWIPTRPDPESFTGRLELVGNTYVGNVSDNYGGVMYARNGAELLIDGDRAIGNTGTLGGAHMLYDVQQIEVRRGRYCNNRAEGGSNPDGGAIASFQSGADGYIVTNNVFAENRAVAWGGGISMLRDGPATVENNTFLANRGADGGGIAFRGTSSAPMSARFVNNLVGYTAGGDGIGARDVTFDALSYGAWTSNLTSHLDEGLDPLDGTHLIDQDPALLAYNPDGDCGNDVPFPRFDSPLRGAGAEGLPNLDGSRNDIGASGGPSADPALWVDDDDDGDIALWDCDDQDPSRGPSQAEVANDGIDQDCDDQDLRDGDGDGFDGGADGPDCDDEDPEVYPGAREITDDGIDQDCDGQDLTVAGPDPGGPPGGSEGCGCSATHSGGAWWLLVSAGLLLRRRQGARKA